MKTAPLLSRFCVTVDSYSGTNSESILEQAVVLKPFVQNKSLTAIGTPRSGLSSPFNILSSACFAASIALFLSSVT